ncbi:MAG: porin family protein [Chromatiales bacterium]|jgi:OOP family OmpA-OmpF porin|nr:porin family protein [Chromatiales bacterium]
MARLSIAGPAAGAALALALTASPAWAADETSIWNFGGAVVFGNYSLDDDTIDDDAVGGKVFLGYRFNRWIGVEGSWLRSGEIDDDLDQDNPGGEVEVDLGGFTVSGLLYAPLPTDDLVAYGKAGYYRLGQDLDVFDRDGQVTDSSSRTITGLTLGAGVRVRVAPRFDIRAEGDWYDIDGGDYWALSLGADYRFGGQ